MVVRYIVVLVMALAPIANGFPEALEALEAHDEYVYMISFSRDGARMTTAAGDNSVIVWDSASQTPTHVLRHESAVYAAALSPDGRWVATGCGQGIISIWDARNGKILRHAKLHRDAVYSVAFSPDGKLLASAGGSTDGGDAVCRVWRASDLKLVKELVGHERQVYGITFSPDGRSLASCSSDKTVRHWNLQSGRATVWRGHTSDVYRGEFSPDGQRFATASQDSTVRIWSVASGNSVKVIRGKPMNPIYGVTYSPGGEYLAAVGDECCLRIWRTDDFSPEAPRKLSPKALYAVAFSPDQKLVMAAGEDGKIYQVTGPTETPAEVASSPAP